MSYSKSEQETYIHFDVETGETTVYSTYHLTFVTI